MPVTACTSNEYTIYTGGTPTPHAIYSDSNGEDSIQCSTVRLGGNGLFH